MWILSPYLFPSMTRRGQASIALQLALLLHCVAAFTPAALPAATAQASRPGLTSHSNCNNSRQKLAAKQSLFRSSCRSRSVGTDTAMAAAGEASSSSSDLELKSETSCFGGRLLRYVHQSVATKTPMTFSVFLPRTASRTPAVPVRQEEGGRDVQLLD